jgi:sulfite exporter TauE/SafE
MPEELNFITAVMIGLLGSAHCIGMCSGIVGALNMGSVDPRRQQPTTLLRYQLAYNLGRISSYCVIGALAGAVGAGFSLFGFISPIPGQLIAAAFMVALGLYLTNWWRGLAILEKLGFLLWRYIQPWGQRIFPINNPLQALLLGMLWGWLPCGLVYAVVAWSVTSASSFEGATLMLGFGLGTLPSMLLAGSSLALYKTWIKSTMVRTLAGVAIIGLGLYGGINSFDDQHQHHHTGLWSPLTCQAACLA